VAGEPVEVAVDEVREPWWRGRARRRQRKEQRADGERAKKAWLHGRAKRGWSARASDAVTA
jgi:hypothetical protein